MEVNEGGPKGLATLALLKAYYDAGKDHVDMFLPFLTDTIDSLAADSFSVAELKFAVNDRHGLNIPIDTLRVILTRARRRGAVKKEGGRYFRVPNASVFDLPKVRDQLLTDQKLLAGAFIAFCTEEGSWRPVSPGEALTILLDFLTQNHVSLLLTESVNQPSLPRTAELAAARFLGTKALNEPTLKPIVAAMLEGLVLQNALLLRDIAAAKQRFDNLKVFIDSNFLMGALGLRGPAVTMANREGLDVLKDAGLILFVFSRTLDEVRRILNVYEHHLKTPEGKQSLHPTDITRNFLRNGYTPADVRQVIALLEKEVGQLGIRIREFPPHKAELTMDETALAQMLRTDESDSPDQPRIVHDVDCIAAIMGLRKGRSAGTLERATAIFATTAGGVVKAVNEWYRSQGRDDVSPIVHHSALSNLAWLKKPARSTKLKLYELVAACEAALCPSRKMWDAFLKHLDKLQREGKLTSDEAVAIVATELTDTLLVEIDDDNHDSATLAEVVERVKAVYKADADRRVATATAEATKSAEGERQVRLAVRGRADWIAHWVVTFLFAMAAIGTSVGAFLLLPGAMELASGGFRLLGYVLAGLVTAGTILSLTTGFHLASLRKRIEARLRPYVRTWLAFPDLPVGEGTKVTKRGHR